MQTYGFLTAYYIWEHSFIFFLCKFFVFDENDVIFRFQNEVTHDFETYHFIEQLLDAPVGCLESVKTFWYSVLNTLILDILNKNLIYRVL